MAFNLNYVVELVKHDLQDFSTSRNQKLLTNALHCLRAEMRLKVERRVAYTEISPNDAFQCAYPADMARYVVLGVRYAGRLITLSVNNELELQNSFDGCGNVSVESLDETCSRPLSESYGWWYAPYFRNGQYVGEQYGQRGGYNKNGYFKLFDEQRIIQFDPNFPKMTYVLGYIPDGTGDTGQTIIALPAVEPIRMYLHWQEYRFDPTKIAMADRKKDEFYYALNEAKFIIHAPTVEEWLDYSYGQYMSGPKR